MTRPPPHELYVSERPVRSDYSRERSYARRRIGTVLVALLVLGGSGYALLGHRSSVPGEVPTIRAEGSYRQKPAEPGGIDIPHQDVRVYDQLEGKKDAQQVEHLLPPPETPKDMPPAAAPDLPQSQVEEAAKPALVPVAPVVPPSAAPKVSDIGTLPGDHKPLNTTVSAASPSPLDVPPTVIAAAPAPKSAPLSAVQTAIPKSAEIAVAKDKVVATADSGTNVHKPPVAKIEPPPAAAAKQEKSSLAQVLANTKAITAVKKLDTPSPKTVLASGGVVIQLASVPDEANAKEVMQNLQRKYAAHLGGVSLHLVRADLAGRGVYYRIQSQGLASGEAERICSSLKQAQAGCILVRK